MLLIYVLMLTVVQCVFTNTPNEESVEKRLIINTDSIASELLAIKAELTATTKRFESEVATLTEEVNSLKMAQQNDHGAVFTRWGRSSCPHGADLVYHGYIAGKKWNDSGSGSDNLCLHYSPTWGNYQDGFDGYKGNIYGTEIDMVEPSHVFSYSVKNHDLPCAVCQSSRKISIMIPARTDCSPGWTLEYTGYLASGRHGQSSYDTVCLDAYPSFLPNGVTSDNQHILYLLEAHCGSLPCPPYVAGREVACAVCTI